MLSERHVEECKESLRKEGFNFVSASNVLDDAGSGRRCSLYFRKNDGEEAILSIAKSSSYLSFYHADRESYASSYATSFLYDTEMERLQDCLRELPDERKKGYKKLRVVEEKTSLEQASSPSTTPMRHYIGRLLSSGFKITSSGTDYLPPEFVFTELYASFSGSPDNSKVDLISSSDESKITINGIDAEKYCSEHKISTVVTQIPPLEEYINKLKEAGFVLLGHANDWTGRVPYLLACPSTREHPCIWAYVSNTPGGIEIQMDCLDPRFQIPRSPFTDVDEFTGRLSLFVAQLTIPAPVVLPISSPSIAAFDDKAEHKVKVSMSASAALAPAPVAAQLATSAPVALPISSPSIAAFDDKTEQRVKVSMSASAALTPTPAAVTATAATQKAILLPDQFKNEITQDKFEKMLKLIEERVERLDQECKAERVDSLALKIKTDKIAALRVLEKQITQPDAVLSGGLKGVIEGALVNPVLNRRQYALDSFSFIPSFFNLWRSNTTVMLREMLTLLKPQPASEKKGPKAGS
jgi:hypothetical protein